ncbi:hypothetical protein FSW04_18015 [Baekduia soli]|uniref:PIN domain-containing protein n=1 Tax=Baekduia soli TaxID=496014 RepID=A0A5B8U8K8_9ACTN|nr:hypothetical protein [Baekduia soli]QEC49287.1 hypothetical protein FSW04_18015 [Baekduia soli]
MTVLRCLIDSMIFDAIAAEEGLTARVDRATSAGRVQLLAAHESVLQIAATPDPARRVALRRVRVLVVPGPDEDDPAHALMLARLRAAPGVDRDDARIASAAALAAVPLVTEDRALRAAVAEALPVVTCWDWAHDLRPRLLAAG